jgi:hypothetical protein
LLASQKSSTAPLALFLAELLQGGYNDDSFEVMVLAGFLRDYALTSMGTAGAASDDVSGDFKLAPGDSNYAAWALQTTRW